MKRLTFAVILTGLLGAGCATGAGRLGTAPPAPATTGVLYTNTSPRDPSRRGLASWGG
jgi:hypothetical protein